MIFKKKDEEYFTLVKHSILTSSDIITEDTYKEVVSLLAKKQKVVNFSQTFLVKDMVYTVLGTVDLKQDHSLAVNAFVFELYAYIKENIEVSSDFPKQDLLLGLTQVELYTINNKLYIN